MFAGIALVVAAGIWLLAAGALAGSVAPEPGAAPVAEEPSAAAAADAGVAAEPGVVRILARAIEADAADQEPEPYASPERSDVLIGEYEHLGPLSPKALASYRESLARHRD